MVLYFIECLHHYWEIGARVKKEISIGRSSLNVNKYTWFLIWWHNFDIADTNSQDFLLWSANKIRLYL